MAQLILADPAPAAPPPETAEPLSMVAGEAELGMRGGEGTATDAACIHRVAVVHWEGTVREEEEEEETGRVKG